jgi:hypothetical protein
VVTMIGRSMTALVVVLAVLVAGGRSGNADEPVVPPPTLPADQPDGGGGRHRVIPEGFLPEEEVATVPLSQPDVYWARNDGPNLPPMLSPCGGSLRSDKGRVDGRQLVLIGPTLWKAARLVVYRDVKAAKVALKETRSALRRCERHGFRAGETTVWASAPLPFGDEALFVGGQQFRDATRVPGIFRGVLMRKGRAVQTYLVCGQSTEQPTPNEPYLEVRAMAAKLARARWAR